MNRRTFLCGLTFAVVPAPLAAGAQQPEGIPRIGFLSTSTASERGNDGFRQGLREDDYVEGRNLLIEWYFAEGRDERLSGFAAELATLRIEVMVALGGSAAVAAKKAATKIPIVFMLVGDPVGLGLVPSLARPSGNITGITNLSVDLTGKRLEVLKEAVPSLKAVAILTHPGNPLNALFLSEEQTAAHRLGLKVRLVEVREPSEFDSALATIAHERTHAVVLVPGPFVGAHRIQIAELAMKRRIPLMGWNRALPESGALMSYGPNNFDIGRRAAKYVGRLLKGAKPADLPIEQPTKFELVINQRTAKALGITIPQSLLLRADEVLE